MGAYDYSMDQCDCSGCDCDIHDFTCPTGFTMSESGACYFISDDEHTFTDCQDVECAPRGATMASYSSADEFEYLQDKLGDRYAWVGVFEGGSDESGNWMNVDGSSTNALAWNPGEPNQWCGNNEDCALMGPASEMSGMLDVSCAVQTLCVCKYGGEPSSAYTSKKSELASTATADYEDCDDDEAYDNELMQKINQIQNKLVTLQNGQADIEDAILDELDGLEEDVEDTLEDVQDTVEETQEEVEDVADMVEESEETLEDIEDNLEDATEDIEDSLEDVEDGVEDIQDTLEDLLEAVGEGDDDTAASLSGVDSHLSAGQVRVCLILSGAERTVASKRGGSDPNEGIEFHNSAHF